MESQCTAGIDVSSTGALLVTSFGFAEIRISFVVVGGKDDRTVFVHAVRVLAQIKPFIDRMTVIG